MGKGYLTDTNAAIDYLRNLLPSGSATLIDQNEINLSVVTQIELLAWPKATDEQIKQLQYFIDASNVINLDPLIVAHTITIRRQHRIKLPDAIIAATSIVNELTLITRNVADFDSIAALHIINPWG